MSAEIVIVNNLDEIDFDALFEGSYPQIDESFIWPGLTTYEEKNSIIEINLNLLLIVLGP